MQKRDAPSAWEIAIVLAILFVLGMLMLLGGCTYTRGPCTVTKQVHYVFACERDGEVIHARPFEP